MFEIHIEESFASAHALRDYYGATEPTHGHNFRVRVTLEGPRLDKAGMLADFVAVQKLVKDAAAYLDHTFINERPPFDVTNPSAEHMAMWFHDRVAVGIPEGVRVAAVTVWETPECAATYRP